ncbi:hypothetical protein QYE76_014772 [Lolium multiflorum]|uniref:Uncharacterized protein n=1 Tax=Lolium multiflorum TaxID=4521 RepID=A0AAD8X741_LOLMU|nr:hypothetical protein QYE76_014772 [Lolium multiflorum]
MRISAWSINTPTRGNSSFVSPHHHFIFLLPRRPSNLNPDELRRRTSRQLATLAEENLRTILRVPVSGDTAEEVPEDEEEEEEQAPRRQLLDLRSVPAPKLPARSRSQRRGLRQEAQDHQAPSARLKESGAGTFENAFHSRQTLTPHHPRRPDSDYRCHSDHQPRAHHKVYEEVSGYWSYNSSSAKRFPQLHRHPQAEQSPPPAANTPPEIIPVSNEKVGGEDPKAKGPAQEETEIQGQGEAEVTSSEKVGAGWRRRRFSEKLRDPADLTSTPKAYATKFFNKLTAEKWELEQDLLNAMLNNAWGNRMPRRASSSLATTSSELENLRSSYQELEAKLKEAEQRKEQAKKQLAEKNSELIREKGEFLLKRNADSETIKRQQKELNGLRKYMETAEHHWDLLATNILEPLGYSERRRNKFPRDDVLSLAGDDCKDLISASRKICHNLSLKKSRTCCLRKLVKRMDILPELVTDLQASSARGAAAMTLTMCLAHNPELDLDRVTTGVPPTADVCATRRRSGYDTRIARRIRHDEFYDKAVLPADEPLEAELQQSVTRKPDCGIRTRLLDQLQGCSPRGTQVQRCNFRRG